MIFGRLGKAFRRGARARGGFAAVALISAAAGTNPAPAPANRAQVTAAPVNRGIAPAQEGELPTYNGQFAFARLMHSQGLYGDGGRFRGGGWGYCNGPPWQHDYPCAERNLLAIMKNSTALKLSQWGNVFDVADPELHKYPLAYLSHPDSWQMDEKGVENLRAYLLKGGFIIFDDFPASDSRFGNRGGWPNFVGQMQRILPELEPIQIDHTHPIFHSFFDFDSLDNLYGARGYGGGLAFVGYFEDNDPTKRMLAIVNVNNDLGENWEYVERGFSVIPDAQNEAFKFGINYIMYALTH